MSEYIAQLEMQRMMAIWRRDYHAEREIAARIQQLRREHDQLVMGLVAQLWPNAKLNEGR